MKRDLSPIIEAKKILKPMIKKQTKFKIGPVNIIKKPIEYNPILK